MSLSTPWTSAQLAAELGLSFPFTSNTVATACILGTSFSSTQVSLFTPISNYILGDTYYSNTVSLLHFDGNATDYGNSSLTWSLVGTSTLSNTTSYFGNGSLHLQSTTGTVISGLQSTADTRFNLSGNTDFTFEMWMNVTNVLAGPNGWLLTVGTNTTSLNTENLEFYFNANGTATTSGITGIALRAYNSSAGLIFNSGYNFPTYLSMGTWHHYVAQRKNYTYYIFVDGICVAQFYNNTALNYTTNAYLLLGSQAYTNVSYAFNGYIDEFRYTYGQARYSGNFIPATQASGSWGPKWVSSPGLLAIGSSYSNTAVANSTVYAYESAPIGGSLYFNGNSSVYLPSTSKFAFSNNLTVEAWVYPTTLGSSNILLAAFANAVTNATGIGFYNWGGAVISEIGVSQVVTNANTFNPNQWTHLAAVRNSGTTTIYINGINQASSTASNLWGTQTTPNIVIGSGFTGYMTNFRYVNGTAVYTSNFTPANSPLSAVTNTVLLLTASSNATILSDSSPNNFSAINNGVVWTQKVPYQETQPYPALSASFNGSNSYVNAASGASFAFGSSLTIEMWVYFNSLSNTPYVTAFNNGGSGATIIYVYSTGQAAVGINGTNQITTGTGAVSTNQWTHIAVVRNGSTTTIYINGVNQGSGTTGVWAATSPQNLSVGGSSSGGYVNGYIAGFRMVNGTAVYTSNFTPSISPPTAISGTTILLNFISNATLLADSGPNNFTVTNINGATLSQLSPFFFPQQNGIKYYISGGTPPTGLSLSNVGSYAANAGLQGNSGIISGTIAYSNTDASYAFTVVAQDATTSIQTPQTFYYRTSGLHDTYYSNVAVLTKAIDVISNASLWNYVYDFSQNNYPFVTTSVSGYETNAVTKFANTASLYFNGTGPAYSTTANAINLGSNNFTIEAWVNVQALTLATTGNYRGAIMSYTAPSNVLTGNSGYVWAFYFTGSSNAAISGISFEGGSGSTTSASNASVSVSLNAWHHVAFVKSGTTGTFYIDGIQSNGTAALSSYTGNSSAVIGLGGIPIAAADASYGANLNGYIQEARLTIGVMRYTANFTPPTAPFPIS